MDPRVVMLAAAALAPGIVLAGAVPGITEEAGPARAPDAAPHKFDAGLYEKIKSRADGAAHGGGTAYYDVLIIVPRDNGDGRDPDETAAANKAELARLLEGMGSRNVLPGGALSFVTASVPADRIGEISLLGEVYRIGDGEGEPVPAMSVSRGTIRATEPLLRQAAGIPLNGSGVTVAVIDDGVVDNEAIFGDRVLDRLVCTNSGCSTNVNHVTLHSLGSAAVMGGSGLGANNGLAPETRIISIWSRFVSSLAHSLDTAYRHGADIATMSLNAGTCDDRLSTYDLSVNEAVDKGMIVVVSAGNLGPGYETMSRPTCSQNSIAVGNVGDRGSGLTMIGTSSRGPAPGNLLKPDLLAPGDRVRTAGSLTGTGTTTTGGTSISAPIVAGAMALMLQTDPALSPAEAKAALLVGASFQGEDGCTSARYSRSDPGDMCSHASRSAPNDLRVINNAGLGVLDTAASVGYLAAGSHVVGDRLASSSDTRTYEFEVSGTDQVKIVMTWIAHTNWPIVGNRGTTDGTRLYTPNLDFVTRDPDGEVVEDGSGDSEGQTIEFAVFTPSKTGTYTVTVNGTGIERAPKPFQHFAIASTKQLAQTSGTNSPPVGHPQTAVANEGGVRMIRLTADDADGDVVTFGITRAPASGTLTAAEIINSTVSNVRYAPMPGFRGDSFEVTPHDGREAGAPFVVTVAAEPQLADPPGVPYDAGAPDPDVLEVASGFTSGPYSVRLPGKGYLVGELHLASRGLVGAQVELAGPEGTHRVAIPRDGERAVMLYQPIQHESITIRASGIDERVLREKLADPNSGGQVMAKVGYKIGLKYPVVVLRGPDMVVAPQRGFTDGGATCNDPQDGPLPVERSIDVDGTEIGRFLVTYACTDMQGNDVHANRTVVISRVGDTKPPRLTVEGFGTVKHPAGSPYEDAGATCTDAAAGDLPVRTENPVNHTLVDTYTVEYTCTDGIFDVRASRTVDVVAAVPADATPPSFAPHASEVTYPAGVPFEDPPLRCTDDTNSVITTTNRSAVDTSSPTASPISVTYNCYDAAGNEGETSVRVSIEEDAAAPLAEPPMASIDVQLGAVYVERGGSCADDFDGRHALDPAHYELLPSISGDVVDTGSTGQYMINYTCVDRSGNAASALMPVRVGSFGGGEEDWKMNPTFGRSWDGAQAVAGGFSFNGRTVDVTDNYHVDFERTAAVMGDENTVRIRAHSDWPLEDVSLYLGVPDISRATDAEAVVRAVLAVEYGERKEYAVRDIVHEQEERLVDEASTAVAARSVDCGPGGGDCNEFEIRFRIMAPLGSDILAISAMDVDRRITTTYVNDGVRFEGEPLLPPERHVMYARAGNQHPVERIELVREDRRYDIWTDQDGFAWLRNSYGSWFQLTQAGFERLADPPVSVMTRIHGDFAGLVQGERERASLVFDSGDIQNEVGGSFSMDAPVRVERLKDPAILERMRVAELAALEYLSAKP
ncbi:MAG: S8 family serine peptidase [Nitrosopumilus sp.]|nr:S8 family serine peptidase [Nitrosopumilus sp.]MDA7943945.1 S8 family serine peptidase [Nitrosopumilus sp.]MDA7999066.1 S8 family serine peptidase [Nitrosopumilus sp.]